MELTVNDSTCPSVTYFGAFANYIDSGEVKGYDREKSVPYGFYIMVRIPI